MHVRCDDGSAGIANVDSSFRLELFMDNRMDFPERGGRIGLEPFVFTKHFRHVILDPLRHSLAKHPMAIADAEIKFGSVPGEIRLRPIRILVDLARCHLISAWFGFGGERCDGSSHVALRCHVLTSHGRNGISG